MCKKNLTTWVGLKKGQKFRIKDSSGGHNYPIGVVLTLKRDGCEATANGEHFCDIAVEKCDGNTVYIQNIELVSINLESLTEEKASLEKELSEVNTKIKFCTDNGTTEFDETEYEIFAALDILEGTGSRKEKAAMLAKILNKK